MIKPSVLEHHPPQYNYASFDLMGKDGRMKIHSFIPRGIHK